MIDPDKRFFLQAFDPHYGCAILEAMFIVSDLGDLRALLCLDADEDPELMFDYWLEADVLAAITGRFRVALESAGRAVKLDRWHANRAAPYLIHTNFELMLLVDGTKKFATMGHSFPPARHEDEQLFDVFVNEGLLHKEVELCPFPEPIRNRFGDSFDGMREVYYALKGEEWRIPAHKILWKAATKTGWNATHERLEGLLFGYEDWHMDWWISRWHKPSAIVLDDATADV